MPKNLKGGKKTKKIANKRHGNFENIPFITKDKEGGQEYAKVIKSFGGAPPQLSLECFDKKERMGVITGKLRKRIFCNKDDIVLVNLRDYQDSKCDIIWKYSDTDIRRLVKEGEITNMFSGVNISNGINDFNNLYDIDSIFQFDEPESNLSNKDKNKDKLKEESYLDSEYDPGSDSETEYNNLNINEI